MKLTFNLGSIGNKIKQNISLVLWPLLVLVIIMEAFVIKRSVDTVLHVRNQTPNVQTQVVRVNSVQYNELEKRLQDNAAFQPKESGVANPFGTSPLKTQ